jgi:hypothetical protein
MCLSSARARKKGGTLYGRRISSLQ